MRSKIKMRFKYGKEYRQGTLGIDPLGNICSMYKGRWTWWTGLPEQLSKEQRDRLVKLPFKTSA